MEEIEAVYEDGVFKPLRKPHLHDREKVVIVVKERVVTKKFLQKLEKLSKALPKFENPSRLIEENRR